MFLSCFPAPAVINVCIASSRSTVFCIISARVRLIGVVRAATCAPLAGLGFNLSAVSVRIVLSKSEAQASARNLPRPGLRVRSGMLIAYLLSLSLVSLSTASLFIVGHRCRPRAMPP